MQRKQKYIKIKIFKKCLERQVLHLTEYIYIYIYIKIFSEWRTKVLTH